MLLGHPHIVLYQPEIPQNTGSIGRLAAGTGCRLHLVRPFGFSASDKNLRRAGLDYWPFLDLEIHDDLDEVLKLRAGKFAFLSKKAERSFWDMPPAIDTFVFGRETSGLPPVLAQRFPELFYQIPMYHAGVRSQNLANAVSVVVYDRLRRIHHASAGATPGTNFPVA